MKFNKLEHFENSYTDVSSYPHKIAGDIYFHLNGVKYSSLRGLLNALRSYKMTSKEFYDLYYKVDDNEGKCRNNNNFSTPFVNIIYGYDEKCHHCDGCKLELNAKLKLAANKDDVKAKKKKALAEFHEKNPDAYKIAANKAKHTLIKNRGENYLSDRVKAQWKRRSKDEIQQLVNKVNATKIENGTYTGGPNFNACGRKIIIEGIEYFAQGYEDAILQYIHSKNLKFSTGKNVPRINCSLLKHGKARPDIYIDELKLILEVKSCYTFEASFDKLIELTENAINDGYIYVIIVANLDKNRNIRPIDLEVLDKLFNMIISSRAHFYEKVQRLSHDREYRPIAIGSGSTRVPKDKYYNLSDLECDIV